MSARRVAIIGFGARGRRWEQELRRRRDLCAVSACDPNEEARAAAAERGLSAHDHPEAALAEADLAIVSSPHEHHADQAVACAEARMPALVEKPFALNAEDAERAAEAGERTGTPMLIGQNFRLRPDARAILSALPRTGAIRSATVVSARMAERARHNESLGVAREALWALGTHHLDLLCALAGAGAGAVEAARPAAGRADGSYTLHMDFPGMDAVLDHEEGAPLYFQSRWLRGERAGLSSEGERVRIVSTAHRPRRVRPPRGPSAEQALLDRLGAAVSGSDLGSFSARAIVPLVATLEAADRALTSQEATA